ncbi:hypothetical protein LG301_10230 [Vreelandella venusta]|uniref:hypothetical protein n=1 Tax=Vreelandella venusta TaxID=44935 RepID=UPI00384D0313
MKYIQEHSKRNRSILIGFVVFVLIISWSGVIDEWAKRYIDLSTIQALAAFATARLFNAAVSLAASVNIGVSLGVGFNVNPFQALDPINDLVEQYSSVMKVAISSLVIQKIIIESISTLFFKLGLTVLGVFLIISIHIKDAAYSFLFFRLFSFFAMIRFLVVMVILLNGAVDQAFVDKNISPNMEALETAADQIESTGNNNGGLSDDERQGILAMIMEFENEVEAIEVQLDSYQTSLDIALQEYNAKNLELADLESGMGTVERLNFISRNEAHSELINEVESKEKVVGEVQDNIEALIAQKEKLSGDIENANEILQGGSIDGSWANGARDKIAEFRDMAKWERIVETVQNIVPNMLNLMAAFTFKTLILPLVFLAILIKGFKYIWGADPRAWVREEYKNIKKIDE